LGKRRSIKQQPAPEMRVVIALSYKSEA